MTFSKFSILQIAFTLLAFIPNNIPVTQQLQSKKIEEYHSLNIDSLSGNIKNNGWNYNYLDQYSRYLKNSDVDYNTEIKKLNSFPHSFQRSFLLSLIYKKQKKFKLMYDSLFSQLESRVLQTKSSKDEISYIPFYNELVFAASASDLLSVLESKVSNKRNSFYLDFLKSLIFYSQGKYQSSLDLLKGCYKEDPSNFSVMYQLSYTYRNLGDYDNSLKILTSFIKNTSNIDDWKTAKILLAEGSLYFLSGKNKEAFNLYNQAYNICRKINDMEDKARALVNLGIISDVEGDLDNSRNDYISAIEIAVKIKDIDAEALAHSELGVSYSFTNELIKAKQNYEKSFKLYSEAGNQLRLSLLSYNLGKIYTQMFDYESALKQFQEGIDYSGENKRAMVENLIGMADVYTNLLNYSKAIQLYRKAQDISREIKEVSIDAQINYSLGALNFGLNRYKNSLDYLEKSLQLNSQDDAYFSAQIFNQMALVYKSMDSLKNAETYFHKAMELSQKNNDSYSEISSCIDLASLYVKKDDLKKAERTLNMARKALERNKFDYLIAQSYLIEGKIFRAKKEFSSARQAFIKAVDLGAKLNEFDTVIEADYLLARLFDENSLNDAAESYYKSAVRLIEDVSRPLFEDEQVQISYYASKDEIYNSFAEFYLDQGEYVKAFELIDRSRSRNTMHNLNNLKLESLVKNDSLLKKVYDYEWILHSNIYSEKETNKAKVEFALLKERLIKKRPEIKNYLNTKQHLSLANIQKNLNRDENFLSIYTSPEKTYLFLINKNKFYHFEIDLDEKTLQKMVSDVSPYFKYSSATRADFYNQDLFAFNSKAAYKLFEKLLKPAFDEINNGEKVIVSASTELLTLPLEFLISKYNENESAYDYGDKNFLVLSYDISYSPSAAIFIQQHQSRLPQNEKVLLVGDPLINRKIKGYSERRGLLEEQGSLPREIPLLPLKYSGEEVREIGNIVKANKVLTAKNATETNFKNNAGQNGIIHLSTHSFLLNKQPVIFFSNYYDPDNDGFLEAGEIVQLKLNSDLVVLSSCNSGLGVIDESEGILGMTKAFFEAGAKSVVVSLWTVNDKYTAKFMTLFYKNLRNGFDKSEALRQAKIEFIKKYSPNPYYWAAFVLSGNVSKLNIRAGFSAEPFIIEILLIVLIIITVIYFMKRKKNSIES